MSFFDGLPGFGAAGPDGDPMQALLGALTQGAGGGWPALLERLAGGGLAGWVQAWMAGNTQSLAPEHLLNALGAEHVAQLAQQAGLPQDLVLNLLSQHLPGLLGAGGQGDAQGPGGLLQAGLGMLRGRFGL
jgi:uncharacterized protein YidB (DUF937 family)